MIDLKPLLAPIPGENPSGESLRYTAVYDTIREARREDEVLDQGEWRHELKRADWDAVISHATKALTEKSKDIQVAARLTEALIKKYGFEGLKAGLTLAHQLLTDFWDDLHPQIDEDDMSFRAAPLEFMNKTYPIAIRAIPLTDPRTTLGYSWMRREESRKVGYESSADPEKRKSLIAEGKITAEDFDKAVDQTETPFYSQLQQLVAACGDVFAQIDRLVDARFTRDSAPRMSDLGSAISDCLNVISGILKSRQPEPAENPEPSPDPAKGSSNPEGRSSVPAPPETYHAVTGPSPGVSFQNPAHGAPVLAANRMSDTGILEEAIWADALKTLKASGLKKALDALMAESYSAPSVRQRNRYRLMIAQICLKGERPDLARPFIEELHARIQELGLERWESPVWVGDVLDTYYQVLTWGEPSSDDEYKAQDLLKKLCTIDVTKAIKYRG